MHFSLLGSYCPRWCPTWGKTPLNLIALCSSCVRKLQAVQSHEPGPWRPSQTGVHFASWRLLCLFPLLFSDPPRSSPSILATVGELHSSGEENNSYVVLAGSSVELTCDGTCQESRLQYAWYRLFPERQYVTNDTVLTLHDVTGDEDNTYVCQVTDPQITTSGRSSESAIVLMVNVLGKPLFFQWNWSYNKKTSWSELTKCSVHLKWLLRSLPVRSWVSWHIELDQQTFRDGR